MKLYQRRCYQHSVYSRTSNNVIIKQNTLNVITRYCEHVFQVNKKYIFVSVGVKTMLKILI